MEFTFENQGTKTFLVYEFKESDVVDSMSLGMLTNNSIPGLAQTIYLQMDSKEYIKYNISSKVSAKQFFEGTVNKKRLTGVFLGIIDAMISAENYMIDPSSILLDLEYMYADVSSCETELICVPVVTNENCIPLAQFFKNILYNTKFDQTENCDYVAKLMNYLNSSPSIILKDFKNILKEQVKVNTVESVTVRQPSVAQPPKQPVFSHSDNNLLKKTKEKTNNNQVEALGEFNQNKIDGEHQKEICSNTNNSNVTDDEPKMTLAYLMQHYNKENAAIYKAQKNSSKNKKEKNKIEEKKKKKPNIAASFAKSNSGSVAPSFAIPGKPVVAEVSSEEPKKTVPQQVDLPNEERQEAVYPRKETIQTKSATFGETSLLNKEEIGGTTRLDEMEMTDNASPYLIRQSNFERIVINKSVFKIGNEKGYSDYCVSDNRAISRSHAVILNKDNEYYIVDTNSTNHTYVNGEMIQSNMEAKLNDGDIIRLANDDFSFKLI